MSHRGCHHNARIDTLALLHERGVLAPDTLVELTPLQGGYWNEVLRVQGDGIDWVVKVYAESDPSALFPILPDDEAQALVVLKGVGVAPAFVAYHPRVGDLPAVLVYEWVAGEMWTTGVEQVAELFRRQHGVAVEGFRMVPTSADAIVEQGERLLESADPADAARLSAVRPQLTVLPARRRVLVHTDAGTGNLIVGPGGVRLIDWQCPALGDAAEDLFAFVSPAFQVLYDHQPLTPEERAAFVAAYDDDGVAARLVALTPAFTYRMGAYCAARRVHLADSDPLGSARYARALDLSLADLREGS